MVIRIFQALSVLLALIAAYFLWAGDKEVVFVSLVLAACAFFLSFRFQAKGRLDALAAADAAGKSDDEWGA